MENSLVFEGLKVKFVTLTKLKISCINHVNTTAVLMLTKFAAGESIVYRTKTFAVSFCVLLISHTLNCLSNGCKLLGIV